MERKLSLYREALVREYWIVDPQDKHIGAHILKDGRYVTRDYRNSETIVSEALPGLEIALDTVFAE